LRINISVQWEFFLKSIIRNWKIRNFSKWTELVKIVTKHQNNWKIHLNIFLCLYLLAAGCTYTYTWTFTIGSNAPGLTQQTRFEPGALSQDACKNECIATPNCFDVDYNSLDKTCFFGFTPNPALTSNQYVTHWNLIRTCTCKLKLSAALLALYTARYCFEHASVRPIYYFIHPLIYIFNVYFVDQLLVRPNKINWNFSNPLKTFGTTNIVGECHFSQLHVFDSGSPRNALRKLSTPSTGQYPTLGLAVFNYWLLEINQKWVCQFCLYGESVGGRHD